MNMMQNVHEKIVLWNN